MFFSTVEIIHYSAAIGVRILQMQFAKFMVTSILGIAWHMNTVCIERNGIKSYSYKCVLLTLHLFWVSICRHALYGNVQKIKGTSILEIGMFFFIIFTMVFYLFFKICTDFYTHTCTISVAEIKHTGNLTVLLPESNFKIDTWN